MCCEVSVRMSNEEKKLVRKELVYDVITADASDKVISRIIEQVRKEFSSAGDIPDKCSVTIKIQDC